MSEIIKEDCAAASGVVNRSTCVQVNKEAVLC